MRYAIKDEPSLKKIVWLDAAAGGATAVIGSLAYPSLTTALGLTTSFIQTLAAVNFLYAVLAFIVALQKPASVRLLRVLIYANWVWTVISVMMLLIYFDRVTPIGDALLVVQPMLVGGLAYLETNQLIAG